MSWADLLAFCLHSPVESALFASMHPDHMPLDSLMLASMEHSLRLLWWAKTDDATKKPPRNRPEPLPIVDKPEPAINEYVPMTIDEMDDFLKSPRE